MLFPEEAVNEVKRQAMAELQKAVAAAETKASQMVEAERAKMDKALSDARKQAQQEVISTTQQQEDSSEVGTDTAQPSQRRNIFVKTMKAKGFFQFEIIINVFVSSFRFIWIPMLWVYGHCKYFNSFSAGPGYRLYASETDVYRR